MDFEEQEENERVDRLFDYLVEEGALELISIDPTSHEPIYRVTPKCKEILPPLYEEFKSQMNDTIYSLWIKNLVEVKFGETNDDDMIRINPAGLKAHWDNPQDLNEEEIRFMNRLMDDTIQSRLSRDPD